MAFKRNGSLMKHDAAGAAAFWARWYLERENWELTHKPDPHPVRMKVTTDERAADDDAAAYEDTWPSSKHH